MPVIREAIAEVRRYFPDAIVKEIRGIKPKCTK
jgi:hypothetical protein